MNDYRPYRAYYVRQIPGAGKLPGSFVYVVLRRDRNILVVISGSPTRVIPFGICRFRRGKPQTRHLIRAARRARKAAIKAGLFTSEEAS